MSARQLDAHSHGAVEALREPRFELVPMRGIDRAIEQLPARATVTVTCSPTHGFEASRPVITELARRGHRVVPHLAARMISDGAQLESIVAELDRLGVRNVFVIAGDAATPAGEYEGAADLLHELDGIGHPFTEIGITGYPEGHSFLSEEITAAAITTKAPHATYLVSQICYDPGVVREWVSGLRARGIGLPLHVGIPGVVERTRLLRISARVGVADSLRFLTRQRGVAMRAMAGYTPDALIDDLADLFDDPGTGVVGWHLFTFNEIASTEQWRAARLATEGDRP